MYVAVFVIISVQASDYNKHPLKCAIDHLLGSITQGLIKGKADASSKNPKTTMTTIIITGVSPEDREQ